MGTKAIERAGSARGGFTYEQVSKRKLPYDWELIAGQIVARGRIGHWHKATRATLLAGLELARRAPYTVVADRRLLVDEFHAPRPDIVVIDESRLAAAGVPEYLPVDAVALAVEIVSTTTVSDEWFQNRGSMPPRESPTSGASSAARTITRLCTSTGWTTSPANTSQRRPISTPRPSAPQSRIRSISTCRGSAPAHPNPRRAPPARPTE